MFGRYVELTATSDQEEAARIRDILNENRIQFRIRTSNSRLNPAPNLGAPVGGIGNGAMNWTTTFKVRKEDFEYAQALIR